MSSGLNDIDERDRVMMISKKRSSTKKKKTRNATSAYVSVRCAAICAGLAGCVVFSSPNVAQAAALSTNEAEIERANAWTKSNGKTTAAEDWDRVHPTGMRSAVTVEELKLGQTHGGQNVGERLVEKEEKKSAFVRRAMSIAKWKVYDAYRQAWESKKERRTSAVVVDDNRSRLGDDEAAVEVPWEDSSVRVNNANIWVIVQPEDQEDHDNFARIQHTLPDAQMTAGITAADWPKHIDDAEWAVAPIRKYNKQFFEAGWKHPDVRRNGNNLQGLFWVGIIDERNPDGSLSEDDYGGSHHIGCLFGHMHAWRTVQESSNKQWSLIMEADGLTWPMKHIDDIVANVPADADFVLLTDFYEAACAQPDEAGFCARQGNTFPIKVEDGPKKGQELTGNFYYWPKDRSGAGFARYLVGPNFAEKVQKYMARFGADMIDAFTFGHLCQDDYVNAKMRDEGFAMPDGTDPFMKRATSEDREHYDLKVLNCYLTDLQPDMIYN
jgi:hypothetical protein